MNQYQFSTNYNDHCNPDKIEDVINFAPFLFFNKHKDNLFENIKGLDKIDISSNKILNFDCNYENNINAMKEAFFSIENVDYLQKNIIINIYKQTDTRIKPQKYATFNQLMNSVWLKYCKLLPYDFTKQIEDLNQRTLSLAIEELSKEVSFQLNYIRDSDVNQKLFIPIPTNTSTRRTLTSSSLTF